MTQEITKVYSEIPKDELIEKAQNYFDCLDVSPNTIKDYKSRIGFFVEYISSTGFNKNSFLHFKRSLAEREDMSVATKNKYLATSRIFLKELYRQEMIPVDITANVKSFSQSSKHKREGLTQVEVQKLVEIIHDLPNTKQNTRLKALFCLLTFQGLRQIEIVRLDVKDIDLVSKRAFVRGKGRDDKEVVHLIPETVKAIQMYIKKNRIGSGSLFKSLGNRKSRRISTMTIKRELGALFEKAGVEKTVHGLRHYYVTTLLKKLDVRDVRKFSRHRSLEMLIVYDDEIEMTHKASVVAKCFQNMNVA